MWNSVQDPWIILWGIQENAENAQSPNLQDSEIILLPKYKTISIVIIRQNTLPQNPME